MPTTDLSVRKHVPTIPQAIKALEAMERQLDTVKTYDEIRRIVREASAIKLLLPHIAEVKIRAEDTVLLGNRRIAEELRKVPKATHRGGPRKAISRVGEKGRAATGIPKDKRSRIGKLADLSKDEVKAAADKLRAQGKDATITAVVRELTQGDKKQRRTSREQELAQHQLALPEQRFGVIYADPPWRFEPRSRETGMDRAADNQYPTMTLDEIEALDVPAAKDAVLFLWATAPMLPQALDVMGRWGFDYRSHCVWVKDKTGTGYWCRNKHELLLIGTRGRIPAPAPGEQWESVIHASRGKHSAKPDLFRNMIEKLFPNLPKLELFARTPARGWETWGNEAQEAAE